MKVTNNYYSYYKYKINLQTEFKFPSNFACFSEIYRNVNLNKNSGQVCVFINLDVKLNTAKIDNYCLLSRNEINEYLRWLRKMTGIKLTKIKSFHPEYVENTFAVQVDLENNSAFEVKFILALIRNMYEIFFNVQLKTAFLMKKMKEFKKLDLSERITISNNTLANSNSNHSSYLYSSKAVNNNQFIERYSSEKLNLVNVYSFYENGNISPIKIQYMRMSEVCNSIELGVIPDNVKKLLISNYELMK